MVCLIFFVPLDIFVKIIITSVTHLWKLLIEQPLYVLSQVTILIIIGKLMFVNRFLLNK
jgi:hypothetical protein